VEKNNAHIFLIDDDEDDREVFCEVLSSINPDLVCKTAGNGRKAMSMLLSGETNPLIIFLDINMPIMNGFEFLRAIRKEDGFESLPIIVYSTSDDAATREKAQYLGATGYMTKPNNHLLLMKKIETVLQSYHLPVIKGK